MRKYASLLGTRERKTLQTAAVFVGLVAAVLLVFAVRTQMRAGKEARRSAEAGERIRVAERGRDAAKVELARWSGAQADLRELASKWFYDPAQGIPGLRFDLRQLFQETGIGVPEITYNEVDLVKDRLRRVTAEFKLAGSYVLFRRFLEMVEKQPRAIHVEKVEFEDIGTMQPGVIQVRATLVGYYLHEE